MRRRDFISLLSAVAAWPLALHAATAQLSEGIRRIAMLSGFAATDPEAQARVSALRKGLAELGWSEGRNLRIDSRWSTGERDQLRTFARELIDLKPDLIVGMTTPAVAALVQETQTIPILFVNIVDPLGRGLISNMARPGGNVTGFLNFEFSMGGGNGSNCSNRWPLPSNASRSSSTRTQRPSPAPSCGWQRPRPPLLASS